MASRMLLTAAAAMVAATVVVAATLVIDQSAPASPAPIPFTWAVGGSTHQVLSQTITAGVDGRLREVRVPIGACTADVVLEVRDVTPAGHPGETLLYSRTYPSSDFDVVVTADFATLRLTGRPVRLSAGDTFAISLSSPGSCGVWPGPIGDSYAGGNGWAKGDGPIVPLSLGTDRADLPFVTIMQTH